MMAKVPVTGPDAHPFFKWVIQEAGFLAKPRWNFFKYLINRQGGLENWFSSIARPNSKKFIGEVEKLYY